MKVNHELKNQSWKKEDVDKVKKEEPCAASRESARLPVDIVFLQVRKATDRE